MLSSSHIDIISKILMKTSYFYITQQDSHVKVWAPQTVSVMSRSYLIVARGGAWAGAGWCGPALSSELSNFNRSVSLWRGDVLTHDTCPHQYPHHAADNSNIFPLTQIFSPLWHGNIFTEGCLIYRLGAAAGCAARRREHGEYKMQ